MISLISNPKQVLFTCFLIIFLLNNNSYIYTKSSKGILLQTQETTEKEMLQRGLLGAIDTILTITTRKLEAVVDKKIDEALSATISATEDRIKRYIQSNEQAAKQREDELIEKLTDAIDNKLVNSEENIKQMLSQKSYQLEQRNNQLRKKLAQTENKIQRYLSRQAARQSDNLSTSTYEQSLNVIDKPIYQDAFPSRHIKKQPTNRNSKINNIVKRKINRKIKEEVRKQLSGLRESRLNNFERLLRARKRAKRKKRLERLLDLDDELEDYD